MCILKLIKSSILDVDAEIIVMSAIPCLLAGSGGAVSIIACIEDPSIITKILAHLDAKSGAPVAVNQLPEPRAPPQAKLFN